MVESMETAVTGVQKRLVAVLFTSSGLFSASMIAAFTLTSIIAADLSGIDGVAGLPNAIGVFGRAAFSYPLGSLLDRLGRRKGLSLGYSLAIAGSLVSVWAVGTLNFAGFLVGALLLGMSRAAGDQSRYVGAEIFFSSRRAEVIGIIVSAGTIGAILGPILVPLSTASMAPFALPPEAGPFVASGVLTVITVVIVFLFLRPDPLQLGQAVAIEEASDRAEINAGPEEDGGRTLRDIFSAPMVQLAIVAMVLSFFVMSMVMIITPLHMDRHDHTTAAISGVIMAHTLGMFGLSWLTGRLISRVGRIRMIVIGTAVLALSCILAPLSLRLPILGLALFLLGLGWNFCYVAGSTLFADSLSTHDRGRAQGLSETFVAIGTGIASLASSLLFTQGQYTLVAAVGLAGSFLLFVATIVLTRRDRRLSTAVPIG